MKRKSNIFIIVLAVLFLAMANVSYALDVIVEPNNIQRKPGERVRVYLYATGADNLISFGIKVSFNPAVLEADSANTAKNTDPESGFVMIDTIGTSYTTPAIEIDNGAGTVFMMGGRLTGTSTTGLTGKVLLGWITFNVIGNNGTSDIVIKLGRENSTFANFVGIGQTPAPVYDNEIPGLPAAQRGIICVSDSACSANFNDDLVVNLSDYSLFRAAFGKTFPDPGFDPLIDLNGDGVIDLSDYSIFRSQFGSGCSACP